MARTVDPRRHEARRVQIIDAAMTCFATMGYDRSTTAAICRTAGIGSGTFFHYFPAKADVVVAMLELGTRETQEWFDHQADRDDAVGVVRDWLAHEVDELADPRAAGVLRAVFAVMTEPAISAALDADDRALRTNLLGWMLQAKRRGEIRTDLSAERATNWVLVLQDGFVGRLAADTGFSPAREKPVLLDLLDRMLAADPPRASAEA